MPALGTATSIDHLQVRGRTDSGESTELTSPTNVLQNVAWRIASDRGHTRPRLSSSSVQEDAHGTGHGAAHAAAHGEEAASASARRQGRFQASSDERRVSFGASTSVEVLQFCVEDERALTTRGPRRVFGGEVAFQAHLLQAGAPVTSVSASHGVSVGVAAVGHGGTSSPNAGPTAGTSSARHAVSHPLGHGRTRPIESWRSQPPRREQPAIRPGIRDLANAVGEAFM